jgi:hypothetical protein
VVRQVATNNASPIWSDKLATKKPMARRGQRRQYKWYGKLPPTTPAAFWWRVLEVDFDGSDNIQNLPKRNRHIVRRFFIF